MIDPRAIVDPTALLAPGVAVGPFARVAAGVRLGEGCVVEGGALVLGGTFGARCRVHAFAVVGGEAQTRTGARDGDLIVGDRVEIREHVTVHRGTDGGVTRVGDDVLLMAGSHVAHDCTLGVGVTVANGVQLAGHVVVEDYVTFGGLAAVAQKRRVGALAFVAGGALCEADVPPFVIVQGDRARVRALNTLGLRRRGVPEATIAALTSLLRAALKGGVPRAEAVRPYLEDARPEVVALARALAR